MFTGESVASVGAEINSALFHTFHLQRTQHYITLFSHPEISIPVSHSVCVAVAFTKRRT